MADEISKKFKIGLSDDDKQQMKNEVVEIVGDITPKGQDTSTNILAFTENKGVYIATDNGAWYYWNELTSAYVYGGLYQENPRLIDLGNNFNEFKSTEENLSLICNKIASRDSGETVASNNYIYHAIVNGNDKVIALYAGSRNSMTFYLSTDSKDTTKYSYFKTYVGTYVEGAWKVERYVGASGGSGTTDFNALFNKPRINGVELVGDVSTDKLGIKIENAVTYKGSVETYSNLTEIQEKAVGDMYNVNDTGRNYVWNGTGWDDMGEIFDLSKLVGKLTFNTTNVKEILYNLIKGKYVGAYIVNDLYTAVCRNHGDNDYYAVNLQSLAGSQRITLFYAIDKADEVSLDTLEYTSTILKEVDPNAVVGKINIEITDVQTQAKEIIYYLIKNKKLGVHIVNDKYIAHCGMVGSTENLIVHLQTLAQSKRISLYSYTAPTANPDEITLESIEYTFSVVATQDYVDTAIQNAITTALNSDY